MNWTAHIAFDSLLATIEQLYDSKLYNLPVIVCNNPTTIVLDPSLEARKFGIKNGMPIAIAKKICPNLVIVQAKPDLYRKIVNQIKFTLTKISKILEINGLDKYSLDISANITTNDSAKFLLKEINDFIRSETKLYFTLCIAPNKFVASAVANTIRPNGIKLITPETTYSSICDLPASTLIQDENPQEILLIFKKLNISKIKDIHKYSLEFWQKSLGKIGEEIYKKAFGIDESKVKSNFESTNISILETLPTPTSNYKIVLMWLLAAVKKITEILIQTNQKLEILQTTFYTDENRSYRYVHKFFPPTNQADIVFVKTKHAFLQKLNTYTSIAKIQLDVIKTEYTDLKS